VKHFKDMIDLFSPLGYKADESCMYATNGFTGQFFWKPTETKSGCEQNELTMIPFRCSDGEVYYELKVVGRSNGILHKIQAYDICHDENLITNIQTAERALVAAWEAIAGVKA
jgi:hypothetical protein